MAEINAAINITSNGGGAAKQALDDISQGFEKVKTEHRDLKEKFDERFQHLGLKLFATESLQAAGVGRETREVINLMNFSLNAMKATALELAIPITALVGIFVALVGILQHAKKAAEEKKKAMDELVKSTQSQLKVTDDTIKSIDTYGRVLGKIPPELQKWRDAEESLRQVQIQRMIDADHALVRSTTDVMNAARERMAALKQEIADMNKTINDLSRSGVDAAVINAQRANLERLTQQFNKLGDDQVANKAKLEGLFVELKRLTNGVTMSLQDQAAAYEQVKEASDKSTKAQIDNSQKEADAETARYQNWAKIHAETMEKNRKIFKQVNQEMEMEGRNAIRNVGQAFGDAFVQMAFHGKNFLESLTNSFQKMTEQIIADIIRIKVEMMILTSMGVPSTGGGFLPMATGGSMLVTKPTMFLAGEGGEPEIASFTPLSKLGGGANIDNVGGVGGGGSNITIGTVETHVHGVDDPSLIADEVGRSIINRIRGMGEVNFLRSS